MCKRKCCPFDNHIVHTMSNLATFDVKIHATDSDKLDISGDLQTLCMYSSCLHNLNDRHLTQNKMENVPGKYKFESQENFDEFLKAQGKTPFYYNTTFDF